MLERKVEARRTNFLTITRRALDLRFFYEPDFPSAEVSEISLKIVNLSERLLAQFPPTVKIRLKLQIAFSSHPDNTSNIVAWLDCTPAGEDFSIQTVRTVELPPQLNTPDFLAAVEKIVSEMVEEAKKLAEALSGKSSAEKEVAELIRREFQRGAAKPKTKTDELVDFLKAFSYTDEEILAIITQAHEVLTNAPFSIPLADETAQLIYNHLSQSIGRKAVENLVDYFVGSCPQPLPQDDQSYDFIFNTVIPTMKGALLNYLRETGREETQIFSMAKGKIDYWEYHLYYLLRHLISTGALFRYIRR